MECSNCFHNTQKLGAGLLFLKQNKAKSAINMFQVKSVKSGNKGREEGVNFVNFVLPFLHGIVLHKCGILEILRTGFKTHRS